MGLRFSVDNRLRESACGEKQGTAEEDRNVFHAAQQAKEPRLLQVFYNKHRKIQLLTAQRAFANGTKTVESVFLNRRHALSTAPANIYQMQYASITTLSLSSEGSAAPSLFYNPLCQTTPPPRTGSVE